LVDFEALYLGEKASDPTVDNQGGALVEGALYFNTTTDTMRVYTGSAWANVAPTATSIDLTSQVTGTLPVANGGTGVTTKTGTGAVVLNSSPTFITPALGTPASGILTNTTGLPPAGVVGTAAILGANTFTGQQSFVETIDTVYAITDGANFEIDPVNGNVQTITLGAARTALATNFAAGQSIVLGVDDGTAYALTWPTMTWVVSGGSGAAPTLATSGYTWVMLWKQGSTLFGSIVGSP
jgi:hypothetical protein